MKVLISTSSFSAHSTKPLEMVQEKGCNIVNNPYSRKLQKDELLELAVDVEGIIAGTEIMMRLYLNIYQT